MMKAVICKNIHKFYGQGANRVEALKGIDLEIDKGELRLLMGPSGSGKTTLISVIAGILSHEVGECTVYGVDFSSMSDKDRTHYRGKNIGFVFQSFNLIPMLTVAENVSIPLLLQGVELKEAIKRSTAMLEELGIGEKSATFPRELSGGQQQRAAIARALVHQPELVVCDEPTSFLDHVTGAKIMEILKTMVTTKGITLIVVTHDPRITSYADHISKLEDGQIIKE
jgi:putative ABC transport system ATP-binding protein